jgi:hypothetical protein
MRNAYRPLVRNEEGKRPLGKPRPMWVDNIKMDLGEIRWGGIDGTGLAQDKDQMRVPANAVMNLTGSIMLEISLVAAQPVAFKVVLSSVVS